MRSQTSIRGPGCSTYKLTLQREECITRNQPRMPGLEMAKSLATCVPSVWLRPHWILPQPLNCEVVALENNLIFMEGVCGMFFMCCGLNANFSTQRSGCSLDFGIIIMECFLIHCFVRQCSPSPSDWLINS